MSQPGSRLAITRLLTLWAVGGAVTLLMASAPADEKSQTPPAKEIASLISQLGDKDFARREKAHQALLQIGKPAVEALRKAMVSNTDAEIRSRATKIVREMDQGAEHRAELEKTRAALRKAVEAAEGVDVKDWAESISNPFTALTEEGKKLLAAEGIDVPRLQKMRARYLTGSYTNGAVKGFINADPDTVLVVGEGFVTQGGVYSVGPVLAVEDAHFASTLKVANLLWLVDRAGSTGLDLAGAPILAAESTGVPRKILDFPAGDYGWRRPKNFLQLPTAAEARNDPPAVEELAKVRKDLTQLVKKKAGDLDVMQVAKPVPNPFTDLTSEGKARLRMRGIDPDRLAKLKAVYLTGQFYGADSEDFVNNDPDTVLVIGDRFVTDGDVCSLGPVLATDNARFEDKVIGADLVWFVDSSRPGRRTRGAPVILAPDVQYGEMDLKRSSHVWHGDYGWRVPRDFPGVSKAEVARKVEASDKGAAGVRPVGTLVSKDPDHSEIYALVFSPDGRVLASAEGERFALWDLAQTREVFRSPESPSGNEISAIAFAPDGKVLATAMADGSVRLWDISTRKKVLTLRGHEEGATSVAFAPSGKLLATGSYDGTIRFWELPAGKPLRTIRANDEGITSVAFSLDGKTLASGGIATTEAMITTCYAPVTQGGEICLWDVATGKELRKFDGRGSVVAFSPDGKTLASGGLTAVFHLNRKPLKDISVDIRGGEGGTITNHLMQGRLRINAVTIEAFYTVRLWKVRTGKEITDRGRRPSENFGSAVAFSPDGKVLAAGAGPAFTLHSKRDGNLIECEDNHRLASLWDVSTGKLLRRFAGEAGAVAFTPDGKTLATGVRDGTIALWDVARLLEQKATR